MHNFTRQLLTEWRRLKLPFRNEIFVVAVSGGADSCALALGLAELKRLKKLDLRFVVAHLNHELRGRESAADERFVRDFAAKHEFELAIRREKTATESNLEQNARHVRYRFLGEMAANLRAFGVITAHTSSDQAETFLMNLIRGSGLEGLGAMKPVRPLDSPGRARGAAAGKRKRPDDASEILLIRPLLTWAARELTEDFCRENSVNFRRDAMNEDLKYSRVRIRKVLLPLLKDFNPKIVETLTKTAFLLRDDQQALEETTVEKAEEFESDWKTSALELKNIRDIFPTMRRNLLRLWLRENRGHLRRLESKHIEAIEQLAFSRKSGRIVELPGGEIIEKKGGRLLFKKGLNNG